MGIANSINSLQKLSPSDAPQFFGLNILENGANKVHITNASQSATRTYTIQDNGSNGDFVIVPTSVTTNQLIYADSGTTFNGIPTSNNGVLITSSGGAPSISSTLPSAVQGNITTVGTITSGTWNGSNIDLSHGGTNATLTASNGGILYSTSSAGAILSGTATARQMLQSGSSAAPAWSTSVWPATTTINQILYSSSANTITGITTANNGVLATSTSGVPTIDTNFKLGSSNTVVGNGAGSSALFSQTATQNVVIGTSAGSSISGTGQGNHVLIGYQAGQNIGAVSSQVNITAMGNTACQQSRGLNITAIGAGACSGSAGAGTTGNSNVGIGPAALSGYSTGSNNIAIGDQCATGILTGNDNTAVGYSAAPTLTTGSNNTVIGSNSNVSSSSASNQIVIGKSATGTANNQVMLGNSSITQIVSGSTSGGCSVGSPSNPMGGTYDTGGFHNIVKTTLTQTDIINMFATPFLIVPLFSGRAIFVTKAVFNYIAGSAAFTNGGGVSLQYGNTIHAGGTSATSNNTVFNASFLTGALTNRNVTSAGIDSIGNFYNTSSIVSTPLYLSNINGQFNNAGAGAQLVVFVEYIALEIT